MRFVYNTVIVLLAPFFFFRLFYRSRKASAYRSRWNERLALYRSPSNSGVIWFHTVSFGEAEAAFPLILKVQKRYPDRKLLVTTTTLTGSNRVKQVLGKSVLHVYLPYDIPGCAARFINRYKPILGVIVETEIWPDLYRQCGNNGVPLAIVNARLSERSARGYKRLSGLVTETLMHLSLVAAQTQEDAQRFIEIGAFPKTVEVTGNLKFDYRIPDSLIEDGWRIRKSLFPERLVWIAASTHKGEEEQILDAFENIRSSLDKVLLILVPRRPERFGRVALLCKNRGYKLTRRSENKSCDESTHVFLLDTMGELKQFYAATDLAYVGGSLVSTGGHNVLEPAALGVPVLFGPHMFNFEKIAQLLVAADGGVQVDNSNGLAEQVIRFFSDEAYRLSIGQNARALVENNRGAVNKVLSRLDRLLDI